jgi:hypothetical protein
MQLTRSRRSLLLLLIFVSSGTAFPQHVKEVTLDASRTFQPIDGFGVNITPAQWRNGRLKPVLDQLVDDLGATLFRFDCYGKADWLDPARREGGHFPESYLRDVYTQPVFEDAWQTFRYLNSRNIEPFFNVSGRIPPAWAGPDRQTLVDYDAYAEMVVSMLAWARNQEHLRFHLLGPFNETDLGFPEGPRIAPSSAVAATKAVLARLDQAGLSDVKLMVMDSSNPGTHYEDAFLGASELVNRIPVFSSHTYGDGGEGDGLSWYAAKSEFANAMGRIRNSCFKDSSFWVTEYGDLDQSGEIEFAVAWRSDRRILKLLNEGIRAGLVWDAFDNFHEHDAAWASYGLFQTDHERWQYAPKPRYFAAKQIYRFVRPGFQRVQLEVPQADPKDVFAQWRDPLRHMLLAAFTSPDRKDLTIIGMSTIEQDTELRIELKNLSKEVLQKKLHYFRTSQGENCRRVTPVRIEGSTLVATIPQHSIFTLTTLDE